MIEFDWELCIIFGIIWLMLSAWASGFNPLSLPRWKPPRVKLLTTIFSFLDVFLPKRRGAKFILQLHEERGTFSHKLHLWALQLTESASLSDMQKHERSSWVLAAFGSMGLIVLGLPGAIFLI